MDNIEKIVVIEGEGREGKEIENDNEQQKRLDSDEVKKLLKGFCLAITYSASIGGTGSLVGSNPNLILKGFYDHHYPESGLNFLTFMLFTLPGAILLIMFTWIWLSYFWLPSKYLKIQLPKRRSSKSSAIKPAEKAHDELAHLMKEKYAQLGPFT
jgi:sodium-dependent dicarboxylate transporter 2/3/5